MKKLCRLTKLMYFGSIEQSDVTYLDIIETNTMYAYKCICEFVQCDLFAKLLLA